MPTLNISLTPELVELVNEKVTSGMYHSASEVIQEGLRLLKEQEELRPLRMEELRREIQKGLDSLQRGDSEVYHSGGELSAHIEAEGRKILAARKSQE